MTDSEPTIVDNSEASRYEALIDGEVAGYAEYERADSAVTIIHTVVEPAYEGRGVGSVLARAALDSARETGSSVLPVCTFVRGYIQRHEDYLELVPAERRAEFDLG